MTSRTRCISTRSKLSHLVVSMNTRGSLLPLPLLRLLPDPDMRLDVLALESVWRADPVDFLLEPAKPFPLLLLLLLLLLLQLLLLLLPLRLFLVPSVILEFDKSSELDDGIPLALTLLLFRSTAIIKAAQDRVRSHLTLLSSLCFPNSLLSCRIKVENRYAWE